MASTLKEIQNAIKQLSQDQLNQFRAWYEEFDADAWDEQIEKDVIAGKLDSLANAAIANHKAGKTKKYNSETAYLTQSPKNRKRLLESIEELESGKGRQRDLIE